MYQPREPKFEALVYTENRALAARCAKCFAEFPVDWVMPYDSSFALDYLSKERFDYVLLDLDSTENCSILFQALTSGVNLHSVVLAVTSAQVDPAILDLCYASRVFYPVRPEDIQEQLYRTVPLAERLATEARRVAAEPCLAARTEQTIAGHPSASQTSALFRRFGNILASAVRNVLSMKHSLPIVAQERVSSVLASLGMMWFVEEITIDFRGTEFIAPPSAGPSYLIALALLLWLCAKHRRISAQHSLLTTDPLTLTTP